MSQAGETKQQIPGYKLLSRAGKGGQGNVYKAIQISMNRPVAVKVIMPDSGVQESELGRFMREARVLARLRHENIVQAIDYGEHEGIRYLVMEYVEGSSVLDLIENEGALGLRRSIEIVIQICRALEHAAGFGVIHRDIKPANIVITKTNRAVLVDFGLARPQETDLQLTMTGTTVGTPHYMSPEQIRSIEKLDGRSDIYALGCTFFHMLTGQVPFPMQSKAEIMASHLREEVKLPAENPEGIPEAVFDVIRTAMEKDREDRYQTAREMMADLTAAQRNLPSETQVGMAAFGRADEGAASKLAKMAAERDQLAEHARRLEERLRAIEGGLARAELPDGVREISDDIPEPVAEEEMVLIPAGPFLCGEDAGKDVDTPRRELNLPEFWLDVHPVTNRAYARFVRETRHQPPAHWKGKEPPTAMLDHPVVWITWQDAVDFAAWSGKRLPSPVEWQKGARGTDGRIYPWGDTPDTNRLNCKESGPEGTTVVGQYPTGASPYGLMDMAGNVAEWVFGKFAMSGPNSDTGQVIRAVCGGSWRDPLDRSRCASRRGYRDGGRSGYVGFRCARDADL